MNWSDERYVRLYTRDTADWLALSFEAQALLTLLLRKADRTGRIACGKHGKRAAAIVIGHPREWPRLEPALEELLADGVLEFDGESLVFRNYVVAQEAKASDRLRQQESRERRGLTNGHGKPAGVTGGHENGGGVTERDAGSQNVTAGHTGSHGVTPSLAEPSLANTPQPPTGGTAADASGAGVGSGSDKPAIRQEQGSIPGTEKPKSRKRDRTPKAPPDPEQVRAHAMVLEHAERWKTRYCELTGTPPDGPKGFRWGDEKNRSSVFHAFRTARNARGIDALIESMEALCADTSFPWRTQPPLTFLKDENVLRGLNRARQAPAQPRPPEHAVSKPPELPRTENPGAVLARLRAEGKAPTFARPSAQDAPPRTREELEARARELQRSMAEAGL